MGGGDDADEAAGVAKLPASRFMRADNKIFYFDTGNNERGTFLRVSEVRTNFRTAITIPEKFWPKFRDTVGDIIGEYQDNKKGSKEEKKGDANGVLDVVEEDPGGDEHEKREEEEEEEEEEEADSDVRAEKQDRDSSEKEKSTSSPVG